MFTESTDLELDLLDSLIAKTKNKFLILSSLSLFTLFLQRQNQ